MNQGFKKYILFWISQSISQLGSSMTRYALILWAYEQLNSALAVSVMSFCDYVPYILVSMFAGVFVDRHSKKKIMLVSDSVAAVCSVIVMSLNMFGMLRIWHIYIVNCVIGFMDAFQSPASSVAIGRMVPKDKLAQVSGMNSFSGNLKVILKPVFATIFYALGGLRLIILIDLCTFILAFIVLLVFINIPEEISESGKNKSVFEGCKTGFQFLLNNKGLLTIIVTMAVINFFSRLTYENILSPMILSRSGNDRMALGLVNVMIGIGGIIGGIIVSAGKVSKDNVKMIYLPAGLTFLLGDMLMGLGRNTFVWSAAGIAASLPIPFLEAGQNVILYKKVPVEMQGRVFAVRNTLQFSTIPIGILLGGFLADFVFEPFMQSENGIAGVLHYLVGNGAGSGMAVMFLITGICGSVFCYMAYHSKEMNELR